ncbi:MAG: hypothetical protein GSR84_08215 [Desulfurococcales archaeon]|nr:hypothetical protein [Desulfurococcales archaeon]
MKRLLTWIIVAAKLLAITFKALSLYLLLRIRLWRKRQVYKARFRLALRRHGIPAGLRRELGRMYGEKLSGMRAPGLGELLFLFKHRERD